MKNNPMKRLIAMALCLCILLSMYVPSVSAVTTSYHDMSMSQLLSLDENLTWVFTGDSITHNGGWTGGYNDYAAWFEKYLYDIDRGDDTLINTAWGGAAIDDFLPTRSGGDGMGLEQFVTKYNPDVVFIKLGMNNRTMGDSTFASKYNAMLDGIYAAGEKNGKQPKVILLSPTPLSGEFGISSGEFGSDPTTYGYYDSVKRFSNTLSSIASQRGLLFVDLRQAMVDESARLGDRFHYTFFSDPSDGLIHPNGAGQYFMFKTICKTLGLYNSSMPIFKVCYDDITDAPLYSNGTAVSYTGSYGDGTSNADNNEMNKDMPELEKNNQPILLASVDFTSVNGNFVYNNTDVNASTLDLTAAAEGVDTLTVAEARTLGKEYSVVFRFKSNVPKDRANLPIIYLAGTSTGGFSAQSDKLLMGMPGTSNIYYQVFKDGNSIASHAGGTTHFGNLRTDMNDGQWHTVAIVQSASGLTYYVDGAAYAVAKDANGTAITINSNIGDMFADTAEADFDAVIGRYGITDTNWKTQGDFDYWQFYKGALSTDEVKHLTANGGNVDTAQMDKTMPAASDASALASVDFSSTSGIFAGTDNYTTSTRWDLTDASKMNDALTVEEVQTMGREFSIVLRAKLDSTTYRNHQALLMMAPDGTVDWINAVSVGGPGAGHNLYYEVRKNGAENIAAANTTTLDATTPDVRDSWHTIAIIQKTDGLDYYVDGVLAQSLPHKLNDGVTFGGLFENPTEFAAHIGSFSQNNAGTYNLKAKLDYYQFYGTALTAAQVASLGNGAISDTDQMNAVMPKLPTVEYVPNLLASVDFTSQNGKLDFGESTGLRIDTATEGYGIDTLTQDEAATLEKGFSVVFRAKLNSTYNTNQPVLFLSSNGTDNWQNALVLGVPAKSNQLYFNCFAGNAMASGVPTVGGTNVNGDGNWHTVAITYDNGTITYYVDGTQNGQVTGYGLREGYPSIGSLYENSENFAVQIGRYGTVKDGTSYKLKGDFDFWQFYDGVLSASQVRKLSTAANEPTVTPAVWTDTVKANNLWAVVGADQMSGYLGETPNFSLFRLLNNGMRGGANNIGSYRDIRMMNLSKPGQTVAQVVANYDAVLGEHQSIYNVLMLLPEAPDVHAAGYAHSADKVAAYKADIQTLIEKNQGKAIVLWTPLASPNATLNSYISEYANAVREIAGEDPTVLLFDANEFMNERIGAIGYNWFDDSMNITPLCATDLVYAFYVHANYPPYDGSKDPTNKGEILSHNLRYGSDKRLYKSGVIKENLSYSVSVSGGTFTVNASGIAGKGYSNLRVAVIPGIGIGSVVEPWILGSVGESLAAPHSNPVITVYGEKDGYTYRFKDVKLSLSTSSNLSEPYTQTSGLTGLEVVGAPAIGFSPDKTTYNVELYQYQRQVRIVAEGGSNLTIKVNGNTVKPGAFSQYITVNDSATVTVTVTGGEADKTYTLNLSRPKYADIIVTEVMTDGYNGYTKSGADNYELIEIYNASGKDLNLLDYSIGYLREYPYSNDKIENGQIPYYFTGNDHNFFGNSYLGINQITKYSSYWTDKVDQEPAEVIFPADSTMVIWVKFSKDSGTDYGASLTYDTLISALEAHSGTYTLTVDVEENGQTVAKTIVPTQEQLVVAEIPYGAAQSNVTQNVTTSATNFYLDGFQKQQNYNNRRGWLFVLDDSAVRDSYGALTEAGDDIISAAKYVRPGDTNKLSNVMYYDVTRGMSVVQNPGYWDSNFSTGHTSDQQGYANMTSFGAVEYWQKPYDFGDTAKVTVSNQTPAGVLSGDDAQIKLDFTDDQDIRYLELYVDADNDGTYENAIKRDITLVTSASNEGKATDVKTYSLTHTLSDLTDIVNYYGFVLDGNNNKTEFGSAAAPCSIQIVEPGQLQITASVLNEAGEPSADGKISVSITLDQGNSLIGVGGNYVVYNAEDQSVGNLTGGSGFIENITDGDVLIVKGLPEGVSYTLRVTVPNGYRDLTAADNLTGYIGTTEGATTVSARKILVTGDLTVTANVKRVDGNSADQMPSVVITLSRGTSPVELADSYAVVDAQGTRLGDTADNTITVSLADGQQAIVKGLPVGTAYTVTTAVPEGYEDLSGSVSGAITGANGASEDLSVKEILITGNLTLDVSVQQVNGTTSDKTVTIEITLTRGNAQIAPTGNYQVVNAANEVLGLIRDGKGEIVLGNGEKVTIQNLPAGTAYTISLANIPDNYEDVTQTALSGNVSADGSAASVAVKEKLITDTLTVNAQVKKVDNAVSDQKITVNIHLEKGDSPVNLANSYTVVDGSGNVLGETLRGVVTVNLSDGEKAVIEGLPVGAKYTVKVTVPAGYENITTDVTTGNVVKTGVTVNVSAKEPLITGSLTVNATVKTVNGAYSGEKIIVKIDLSKGNAPVDLEASYDIFDAEGTHIGTVTNGTATIEMGTGQNAIIKNVAEGAAYTVTVTAPAGYENTTTDETTGNVVKTGSVVKVSAKELLIINALDAYDIETVKSTDKADIRALVEKIDDLLAQEPTEADKKTLETTKAEAEALLARIDEAADAADIGEAKNTTAENVKPENRAALEKAQTDLEKALEDYAGNYTDAEKAFIRNHLEAIAEALKVLDAAASVETLISTLPDAVSPDDAAGAEKILAAKAAYDTLSAYEKTLLSDTSVKKLTDLVAELTAYKIIKGDGSRWTKGSKLDLSMTANGAYSKFTGIKVDGKAVASSNYAVESGSTVVTLKADYLEKLSTGKHTLTLQYTDGEATGTFTVKAQSDVPETGDVTGIFALTLLMALSAALVVLLVMKRRWCGIK